MPNDRPGILELLGLLRKHGIVSFEAELETLINQTLRGVQKSVGRFDLFLRHQNSKKTPGAGDRRLWSF